MQINDSRAAFPNGIWTLIVDSDARFLRTATLMLSLLNFRVATCESPAAAVKLVSGRLKDADVVFIDALKAATCGFDFRGIVERHLCIPVVYFFSFDYKVTGDVAEALRRTVWAATYVIKKHLDAGDLSRLWRIIQQSKFLLRRGENTLPWLEWPRGNRALPATVEALPGSSTAVAATVEDNDGSELFKVLRAGRGQKRKLGDGLDGGVAGRATEGQKGDDDDDVVPSDQQQNRRGDQAMGVQNQQHGRSLFMQPVPQLLNVPRKNAMISADAAGPSSSNSVAFAVASNTSAPALLRLPVYQAPARATSPAPHAGYSAQAPRNNPMISAGRRGGVADSLEMTAGGQPARRLAEKMNLIEVQDSDDDDVVPGHQQRAQQNRGGFQAMDVQNQQRRRSLFMKPIPQMLNVPRNYPMISADAAGPSSSNATAFAGAAPALLPAYQAPAVPGQPPVHQQQRQPVSLYDLGKMVAPPAAAIPTMAPTSGHQPQFTLNHQQQGMFAPWRQGGWMGRRRETGPIMLSFRQPPAADPITPMAGGDTTSGASPTGATATDAGASIDDAAVAHLQSPSVGAQPVDSSDDVHRALRSYYANCSAEELLAPTTTDKLAAKQAAPGSGNCSNYNAGSFMVSTDVNGGNSASFMAPQDPAVLPTGNQVELGAPDIYGSLVGSPGPSAMFNGNGDMAAMFPPEQYDENAMLSLDALWNFDDNVPLHPQGQQQVAAADSTAAANAAGIMSNGRESGGLGPNWNMGAADNGLGMTEVDHNAADFLLPQDMNNGHQ